MGSEGLVVELHAALSADPKQVAVARRLLRGYLTERAPGPTDAFDVPVLLVSELVTNAIRHAQPPLELHAAANGTGVRVEVRDGATDPPVLTTSERVDTSLSEGGRGLHLVASLSDRWGWHGHADGKAVWFELDAL